MQTTMSSSFLGSRTALAQPARQQARSCSRAVVRAAADSPVWLPGTDKPKQLEGLVGNFGFDPLQLGTDKERLEWCASGRRVLSRIKVEALQPQ